ncbi:MAG: hypothetical protein WCV85_02660 [Patescibacteria group bacterium]|jgi:hypothetical protein
MILFLRSIPTFLFFWVGASAAVAVRYPSSFWYVGAVAVLGIALGMWVLTRGRKLPVRTGQLLIFPLFFLATTFGVLLFVEHAWVQTVLAGCAAGLLGFATEQIFRFAYQPARYQANALHNVSVLFAAIGLVFGILTLANLTLFAGLSLWLSIGIAAVIQALWVWAYLWVNPLPQTVRLPWAFSVTLVGAALVCVLMWLPPLPVVKAALYAAFVGLAVQVARAESQAASEQRIGWAFALYGLVVLFVVVTARWYA